MLSLGSPRAPTTVALRSRPALPTSFVPATGCVLHSCVRARVRTRTLACARTHAHTQPRTHNHAHISTNTTTQVRMGDREHGAKGLCQERAYVSGLEAANKLARDGHLNANTRQHPVLAIREDEPQVVLGRQVNKQIMDAVKPFGLASPWVR